MPAIRTGRSDQAAEASKRLGVRLSTMHRWDERGKLPTRCYPIDDSNKDFWTHVVVFVSKDEHLTKAHVRWLEATLVREIRKAKRAEVHNANDPVGGKLPEADTAGNPNLLRFTQEYAFDSPSKAASVTSGTGLNGRVAWKVKGAGISYKEWQEKLVAEEGSDGS